MLGDLSLRQMYIGLFVCTRNVQSETAGDSSVETPPLQQRQVEETEEEQGVKLQEEKPREAGGSRRKAKQNQKSDRYCHLEPEKHSECMGELSIRTTGKTGRKVEEEEDSMMEGVEEGDDRSGNSPDGQPTDSTATDSVLEKSPAIATKADSCGRTLQTGGKFSVPVSARNGSTAVAGKGRTCPKSNSDDFLSALNLQPRKRAGEAQADAGSGCSTGVKRSKTANQDDSGKPTSCFLK